jgi:hypothetical protein
MSGRTGEQAGQREQPAAGDDQRGRDRPRTDPRDHEQGASDRQRIGCVGAAARPWHAIGVADDRTLRLGVLAAQAERCDFELAVS